jgi:LmbE family N-acetylglucosaminyl deacetylase
MFSPVPAYEKVDQVLLIAAAAVVSAGVLAGLVWAAGALYATDRSVPAVDPAERRRRVLAVFPHADDETVTCGGTLARLARSGCHVTLVVLTRGERGHAAGTPCERLAEVRTAEALRAAEILGIGSLVQYDLGDGELQARRAQLTAMLEEVLASDAPDLVITYDPAGLYGHEDHIACSDVVTDRCRDRVPLWYVALPLRLQARVPLDPALQGRRPAPTHRVSIRKGLRAKIRAWYRYRSQRASLRGGVPRFVPMWVLLAMAPFEHFAEAPRS